MSHTLLRTSLAAAWFGIGLAAQGAAPSPKPQTRAERSDWTATSTNADVLAHLAAVRALPHGDRLTMSTFGHSAAGRPLPLVRASIGDDGDSKKLRALILANIHGGEVEGKEAVQVLLREIAQGEHEPILRHVDLWFVPVFNADGNDQIDRQNRVNQNGPDGGVGERHNAQDLDLNRDFVKAESPEVRALLRLFVEHDPHLFMDLHTTNGSHHGFHLTYAPSLSTNQDPRLVEFCHDEFLPAVRAAVLERHGFRVFDYGNFPRSRGGGGQDPTGGWYTYGHEPRYGTNYCGLRNRIAVLSEAYSYVPYRKRAAVTRAFVLENLRALVERRDVVARICEDADRELADPDGEPPAFHFDTELAAPTKGEVLVAEATPVEIEGTGRRWVIADEYQAIETPLFVRFHSKRHVAHPFAWAVIGLGDRDADDAVRRTLLRHGLRVARLTEARELAVEEFRPSALSRRRFQGMQVVSLDGALAKSRRELPAGTLIVPAQQELARVAAQLLEGHSEDSLAIWNFFAGAISRDEDAGDELAYPVLRILDPTTLPTEPCTLESERDALGPIVEPAPAGLEFPLEVRIVCTEPGRRAASRRGFESGGRFQGRVVHWELRGARVEEFKVAVEAVAAVARHQRMAVVLVAGEHVSPAEVVAFARAVRDKGCDPVYVGTRD